MPEKKVFLFQIRDIPVGYALKHGLQIPDALDARAFYISQSAHRGDIKLFDRIEEEDISQELAELGLWITTLVFHAGFADGARSFIDAFLPGGQAAFGYKGAPVDRGFHASASYEETVQSFEEDGFEVVAAKDYFSVIQHEDDGSFMQAGKIITELAIGEKKPELAWRVLEAWMEDPDRSYRAEDLLEWACGLLPEPPREGLPLFDGRGEPVVEQALERFYACYGKERQGEALVASQDVARAGDPEAPSQLLEQLGQSASLALRVAVAKNPSAPLETLALLAESHPSEVVLNRAFADFSKGKKAKWLKLRKLVASHDQICPEASKVLCEDEHEQVRAQLCRNAKVTEEVLETLAKDTSVNVRKAVARNKKTPATILESLVSDTSEDVQKVARKNRNTPPHLRK